MQRVYLEMAVDAQSFTPSRGPLPRPHSLPSEKAVMNKAPHLSQEERLILARLLQDVIQRAAEPTIVRRSRDATPPREEVVTADREALTTVATDCAAAFLAGMAILHTGLPATSEPRRSSDSAS